MGKRRHLAALGATFALLVAACATSDSQLANAPELSLAPRPSTTVGTSVDPVAFPGELADASFIRPDTSADTCRSSNPAHASLLSAQSGEELWSVPIPEPGNISTANETSAFIGLRADRGQAPGLGALDLATKAPLWQRFFETAVQQLQVNEEQLLVVTRDTVRSIDPVTGEDLWVNDSQFDFDNVILTADTAYALDSVSVRAISLTNGRVVWSHDNIERGDRMSISGNTITVAAGTRIIAIDIEDRKLLWEVDDADRIGAGDLWSTPTAVFYELSPNVAPGGGVAALNLNTGERLWAATNTGTPAFVGTSHLITSKASEEPPPGEPFVFVGLAAATGEELWRLNSTTQVFDGVVGTTENQIVISDPHPAATGYSRLRLVNTNTGGVRWQSQSNQQFQGAEFELGPFVAIYGTTERSNGDTGNVSLVRSAKTGWSTELSGGVAQPPVLTSAGLLVVAPSQFSCIGRVVVDPAPVIGSAVLGAATERATRG